jgi:hypothetical protein
VGKTQRVGIQIIQPRLMYRKHLSLKEYRPDLEKNWYTSKTEGSTLKDPANLAMKIMEEIR